MRGKKVSVPRGEVLTKQYTKMFNVSLYATSIMFIFGGTQEQGHYRYLQVHDLLDEGDKFPAATPEAWQCSSSGSFFFTRGIRDCAIWMPLIPESAEQIGTASHEAVHAALHILTRIGFSMIPREDEDMGLVLNDEPITYLQTHILVAFLEYGDRLAS